MRKFFSIILGLMLMLVFCADTLADSRSSRIKMATSAFEWVQVGSKYFRAGDLDSAIEAYSKARAYSSGLLMWEAYYNRGISYDNKGQYDLAIEDYTNAIYHKFFEENPNHKQIAALPYHNRGVIYEQRGQYDLAIADYTNAIQLNSFALDAYNNRGICYAIYGRYDLAIADFSQAIQRFFPPAPYIYYYNRANAYKENGQYDLAIADFSQAIQLNPQDADAYYNRGDAYKEKGQSDLAMADYTKANQLNPHPSVKRFISSPKHNNVFD